MVKNKNKNTEMVVKEKDQRFRKITIIKNLSTNIVDYHITGFGNPIDIDTLWGFLDNECVANLIKQRIVKGFQENQQNKVKPEVKDAEKG